MSEKKTYTRFTLSQRVEHFLVIVSFTLLVLTGVPQKYAGAGWAQTLMGWMGGIENTRRIHHAAAVLLILEAVLHIVLVGYRVYVRGARVTGILPNLKDIYDFLGVLRYNLGLQQERPLYDRYNFEEKIEYWAVIWGTVIMVLTGFVLWNPIATTHYLPGEIVPISKAAHGGEALLALLSILTWHFYGVHLRHFNKSIFTGKLSREEMLEEHPLELARIEAGEEQAPPPELQERRRRRYIPFATGFTILSLALVYGFVTLETTAIETIPEQEAQVVFERVVPQPTVSSVERVERAPAPIIPHSLEDRENCRRCHALGTIRPFPENHTVYGNGVCLNCHQQTGEVPQQGRLPGEDVPSFGTEIAPALQEKCVVCHGVAGGLNLSSYSWLMAGGEDGPTVVPGEPEDSLIIRVLEAGHFATFSDQTMQTLREWIAAGAPNN